jgi:hypothetical protein
VQISYTRIARQDLFCSFIVGTERRYSHESFPELAWKRDPFRRSFYQVPLGFMLQPFDYPRELRTVLENINALCVIRNNVCMCGESVLNRIQIDNAQANIESSLVNLQENSLIPSPIFRAIVLAAYACTYNLSTEMWEATFLPNFCSTKLLSVLQDSELDACWDNQSEMLIWLLYVGGSFAENKRVRLRYLALIHGSYRSRLVDTGDVWEPVKTILSKFIWSSSAFEERVKQFWSEVYPA